MPEDLPNLKNSISKLPLDVESKKKTTIPPAVAISDEIKEYENERIVFNFINYKQSRCEIHLLQKSEVKKLTEELKKINGNLTKNIFCQQASGIACKPINKSGEYACLFNELPDDVQILEIDYAKSGRIFGYLVKNIFNIVSIKKRHLK